MSRTKNYLWKKKPTSAYDNYGDGDPCTLARKIDPPEVIGVTITSPKYRHLTDEAVRRFRKHSGLDVIVLWSEEEPAFAAKLNLDLLVAPMPIVFFDVDLWLLRPFDFKALAKAGRFCAVPDPGAWNPLAFPHIDSKRNGWNKESYFNSGLFACDLARPEIRRVFADARRRFEECHANTAPAPVDWTDQFFLNWAIQQQPGLLKRLPFALNFYKKAVDWGSYPHIPREIVGLHAAGIPLEDKLENLRRQAAVFGEPIGPMHREAIDHHYQWRVAG